MFGAAFVLAPTAIGAMVGSIIEEGQHAVESGTPWTAFGAVGGAIVGITLAGYQIADRRDLI